MVKILKVYGLSVMVVIFYAILAVAVHTAFHLDSLMSTFIAALAMICICGGQYMSLKLKDKGAAWRKICLEFDWKRFFIILGIDVAFAYMSLTVMTQIVLVTQDMQSRSDALHSQGMVFMAFYSIIVAPITEEIIYRLYIYNNMKSVSGWLPAMFGSSFLFAISHMTIAHAVVGTLFGMFLVLVYEISGRNIMVNIVCHMIYNLLTFVLKASMLPYKFVPVGIVFLIILSVICGCGIDLVKSKRKEAGLSEPVIIQGRKQKR